MVLYSTVYFQWFGRVFNKKKRGPFKKTVEAWDDTVELKIMGQL